MTDHQERLGTRLRAIRRQQGLTLQDVEERSGGEWKAVVVGSYERGDRAISIAKLAALSDFYGVPMRDVLPSTESSQPEAADREPVPRVCLDLTHLDPAAGTEAVTAVSRYARRIQVQRGDYNGRVLTIRRDDLQAIALAFGTDPDDLVSELEQARALVR